MPDTFNNFTDTIFNHAVRMPRAIALADDYGKLTWKQLADLVGRASVWLDSLGIAPGDPVGVRMTNSIDHIILSLALMRVGAAKVEFSTSESGRKFDAMIETLGIRTLFVEPPARSLGGLRSVNVGLDWREGLSAFKGDHKHPDDFEPFDIALSSGSTGQPKGYPLGHAQQLRRMEDYLEALGAVGVFSNDGTGNFLLTSSMSFGGFLYTLMNRLGNGGRVTVLPEFVRLMDLVRAIQAQNDAVLILTSAMCEDLLSCAQEEGVLFPKARAILSLGSPLAARTKRGMLSRVTPNFAEAYGGTSCGLISVLRPEDMLDHADSVGRLFAGVEVEIVDAEDKPVAPGVTGHLRCRGSGVSPEVISEAPQGRFEGFRDGWCYPGDLAAIDGDGYVYLRGRVSEVVRRHGVDVMPTTVELALMSHPGVREVAVIGVTRAGASDIIAVIQPSGKPDPQVFHSHCIDKLGAGQAPGGYLFVKAFPRTSGGKIDRAKLREKILGEAAAAAAGRRSA
ncbi:class I adenylate-forming enzyme family protein [Emcibacter sp. SYSU 3D8]|uniref:class I adenylate-forming enzyme family protein n=1 Tax=Emcibacter sp. SYSU 3D8 TaxID=3133969 RepID=UPI0031FE7F31